MDDELFEVINCFGSYILLSGPVLNQSIKETTGILDSIGLLSKMSYILVSSLSAKAADDLIKILPVFEEVKVSNNTTLDVHRDLPEPDIIQYHRTRGRLQIGQTRSLEKKSILTQDDFRNLQSHNRLFVYNAVQNHIWIV